MNNNQRQEIIQVFQYCHAHNQFDCCDIAKKLKEKGRKKIVVIDGNSFSWDLIGGFAWSRWKFNGKQWGIAYLQ